MVVIPRDGLKAALAAAQVAAGDHLMIGPKAQMVAAQVAAVDEN
jgi:hypothetical protein